VLFRAALTKSQHNTKDKTCYGKMNLPGNFTFDERVDNQRQSDNDQYHHKIYQEMPHSPFTGNGLI
jgi:predicted N-acyltransferase